MRTLITLLASLLLLANSTIHAQRNDSIISKGLGEVEISAFQKPSTAQSSTPLQVLTEKDILKQGILSVSDAVKRFNGVVLKDYGGVGGIKTVSIRGMGAEYTTISYDGIVINNLQSGQVDIGRFSLDNISMLSLSIGQDDNIFQSAKAFSSAGVLNLETRAPLFDKKNHRIHTKVTTGSFGHFEPMIDYAYKISNKVSLATNVNWQRADGMYSFDKNLDIKTKRKRENSDTDILRSEINLFTRPSNKDFLDAKLYYFDSERGLPKAIAHTTEDIKRERLWDKNAFAQIAYKRIFSNQVQFKSRAKYDYNYSKYRGDIKDVKSINRYELHEVYFSNSVLYSIIPPLSISLAEDLSYNSLRAEFGRNGDFPPQPDRYSSFTALAAQYKTQRFTVTASGLATYVKEKTKGNVEDKEYKKLAPSISASVKPFNTTNLRFRASYKHVYRIPSFTELYYSANSRSLKPETSKQYNVGTTWVGNISKTPFEYINLSADVYYNDINDKIVIIPTLFQPRAYNVGKVIMKGLDLKASTNLQIYQKISLDLTGVYSRIRAYDDEKKVNGNNNQAYKKQLEYTPKNSGSASITLNNPWVNFTYSVLLSDIRFNGKENLKTQEVKSYTDHSISLFKEMKIKEFSVYTNVNLNNIFNENYEIISAYPMPGRSFKVVLGCRF